MSVMPNTEPAAKLKTTKLPLYHHSHSYHIVNHLCLHHPLPWEVQATGQTDITCNSWANLQQILPMHNTCTHTRTYTHPYLHPPTDTYTHPYLHPPILAPTHTCTHPSTNASTIHMYSHRVRLMTTYLQKTETTSFISLHTTQPRPNWSHRTSKRQ